jgi:hypothetical protein
MRRAVLAFALAVAAVPVTAEVTVRVAGARVDLTATAAPVAEVLDRLARQTGMKVVYEGPAPRQLVTLSIQGRTPAEAVLSVLEGLGVNFALVADSSGARVQTLVVSGGATGGTAAASAASSRPAAPASPLRFRGPPPGSTPETVDPAFEQDEEEEPEDSSFSGLPPGAEMPGQAGVPAELNAPAPAAEAPAQPAGPGATAVAPLTPTFPSSPFTPQPQPFPPLPHGIPGATGPSGSSAQDASPAPAVPPQ